MKVRFVAVSRALVFVFACLPRLWLALANDSEAAEDDATDEYLMELAENPLDINDADAEELAMLPGVSLSSAGAVVERRAQLGCFRSLSDLVGVGGLTEPAVVALRPYLTVGSGCADRSLVKRSANWGIWRSNGETVDAAAALGAAADVHLDRGGTKLHMRYRKGRVDPIGGTRISLGRTTLLAGDMRVSGMPPLAAGLGRDPFAREGPLPGAPTGSARCLGVATGAGERLRGAGVQAGGRVHAIFIAGTVISSWGSKSDPVGLLFARLVGRPCFELWGGVVAAIHRSSVERGGSGFWGSSLRAGGIVSAECARDKARCIMNLAARGSAGAWLVSLSAEPEGWNRLALVAAGRWGDFTNPLGIGRFRRRGAPGLLARATAGLHPRLIGTLRLEQRLDSDAAGAARSRRDLTWQRRVLKGTWVEGDLYDESVLGNRDIESVAVKLIRRTSRQGWAEVLCKASDQGDGLSTLFGWRAGAGRAPFVFEIGGFSFRSVKSLYFYEKEMAGRSSIKALKGDGMGWYLYLRLEPDSGSKLSSVIGSAEIKMRRVVRCDSPASSSFIGVQIGRGGG